MAPAGGDLENDVVGTARRDSDGIQWLILHGLLRDIGNRLSSVEDSIEKRRVMPSGIARELIDLFKALLGSWAAFAFLFLLLFYAPLRDVFSSLPDKIRSADEIGLGSVTLKSTIQRVAASQGVAGLGEAIPALSNQAIQILFRAPRDGEGLMSFTSPADNQALFSGFSLPTDSMATAVVELANKGFIHLEGRVDGTMRPLKGDELYELIRDIKKAYPGHAEQYVRDGRLYWALNKPIPREAPHPDIMWRLSDSGITAVNVMITSVGAELARSNKNAARGEKP